ncbi:MAG: hypothetical protein MMC33_004011 [Icmadophila ericetorum]|nr:hypothetical protein [Icmadophila ericetorum]
MGARSNPDQDQNQDQAPAYEDLFADHPVNQSHSSRQSDAYIPLPTSTSTRSETPTASVRTSTPGNDTVADCEEGAGSHNHTHHVAEDSDDVPALDPSDPTYLLLRDMQKPHTHCSRCEKLLERKERANQQNLCCWIVASIIVVIALLLFVFLIVLAGHLWGKK